MNRDENHTRELVLIRHGESEANARGIWQGQLDFPLSKRGRRQAALAGGALRSEVGRISAVYASPLARAFETADILVRESGFKGEVVPVAGLTERGGGLFEGSTWAEREETMPEVIEKFRASSEEDGWREIGAETDEEIVARFAPAIEDCMSGARPGSLTVIVAHGGVMRAYLREKFGPGALAGDERAANASITKLSWPEGERPTLVSIAETAHLLEDPARPTSGPASE